MSNSEKVINIKTGKLENCTVGAGCQRHAHSMPNLKSVDESVLGLGEKWFVFDQNNSGGFFKEPAQFLIIKASDADDANKVAEELGAYFKAASDDCIECCGERWTSFSTSDVNEFNIFKSEKDAVEKVKEYSVMDKNVAFYMVAN